MKKLDTLKVIKGVEVCMRGACSECPYYEYGDDCMEILDRDSEKVIVAHAKDEKKDELVRWLMQKDEITLKTAIMYAEHYIQDGINITEKWETAVHQAYAMQRAENRGYAACMKSMGQHVRPEPSCEMTYVTDCACDHCGVQLIREDKFCRGCGRPVDWSK